MDRPTPRGFWTTRRRAVAVGALVLIALGALTVLRALGPERLRAERSALTLSTVTEGTFQEYAAVTGRVEPGRTVYLDAVVGGQVAQRLVSEGDDVSAGQPLMVLANDNLKLQTLSSEAQLQEQISTIRSQRLALDQNRLQLSQQLVQLEYDQRRLDRERARLDELAAEGFAPAQDLERVEDELRYVRERLALTRESHQQDEERRALQLRQMDETLARLGRNLRLVRASTSDLVVRAPFAGRLSSLSAELGESKMQGARLGRIDAADDFKVVAAVDEFHLARVSEGLAATATLDGEDYPLHVTMVYPEVADGAFQVDLAFADAVPPSVRRGQTVQVRLELGAAEPALLVARGGFYQSTGGRWVYVLTPSGDAVRRTVELGRQNPQAYEVRSGLRAGERVITSSYDALGDAETLTLY